ncbi:MAG: L-serine ammonia-lyase [Oceanospirillales bacterium LUC14_002_19_P2]|nr:MAG: L-serine ammonia-lyase [Oceanospirillales bacterium LUC14_002_19_P2]
MTLSVFDLFKIGIGPSSSHTVGPMKATCQFVRTIALDEVARIRVELYGALALTGAGHATDQAVVLGLMGEMPESIDPETANDRYLAVCTDEQLCLPNQRQIHFDKSSDIIFNNTPLPEHPNGLRLLAFSPQGVTVGDQTWFSVGGGFIVSATEIQTANNVQVLGVKSIPYPFESAEELLSNCLAYNLSVAQLMMANEIALHGNRSKVEQGLRELWQVMDNCIERGCRTEGILPGGLDVKRRAAGLYKELTNAGSDAADPLLAIDWVSLFALAVNEENAAGGRVVTAPTNGAAGVIPAVIAYYMRFINGADEQGLFDFMLTAAAIGMLYKKNASISAAEVGCQGEIGVACSMAAAGLTAVLGGSVEQIENAAEIGMEHNLGMTCDPIAGLVQIPCIERNTMGAVKAINAARLALRGDGSHRVTLDEVIETMHQTGKDMQSNYKETALGGLAVNVILC